MLGARDGSARLRKNQIERTLPTAVRTLSNSLGCQLGGMKRWLLDVRRGWQI